MSCDIRICRGSNTCSKEGGIVAVHLSGRRVKDNIHFSIHSPLKERAHTNHHNSNGLDADFARKSKLQNKIKK